MNDSDKVFSKKIVYLIPHLGNSGPVTHMYSLLRNLDPIRYNCKIITIYREQNNSMMKNFLQLGIEVIQLSCERKEILKARRLLKYMIWKLNPDIIHSESVITDILLYKLWFKMPIVTTAHNYPYDDLPLKYGKVIGRIMAKMEIESMKDMKYVISCSDSIYARFLKKLNKNICVIQNGLQFEDERQTSINVIRKKYHIPTDAIVFISTSTFVRRKNIEIAIEAFEKASPEKAYLIMLGTGDLLVGCKKKTYLKKIIFVGEVNDVSSYLDEADVFISLSKSEGLPYGVLEAGFHGLTMILSNIPEHHEIIEKIGKIDYWIDLSNGEMETIKAIEDICKYSRLKLKKSYNMKKFEGKEMAKKYSKLYERC